MGSVIRGLFLEITGKEIVSSAGKKSREDNMKCPDCKKNLYFEHSYKVAENTHHIYICKNEDCAVQTITKTVRLEP